MAALWLTPRVTRFWREHPDIRVSQHSSDLETPPNQPHLDLRIRYGEGPWPGEDSRLLFGERDRAALQSLLRRRQGRRRARPAGCLAPHPPGRGREELGRLATVGSAPWGTRGRSIRVSASMPTRSPCRSPRTATAWSWAGCVWRHRWWNGACCGRSAACGCDRPAASSLPGKAGVRFLMKQRFCGTG